MLVLSSLSAACDARGGLFWPACASLVIATLCAWVLADLIDSRWVETLREWERAEVGIAALQQTLRRERDAVVVVSMN